MPIAPLPPPVDLSLLIPLADEDDTWRDMAARAARVAAGLGLRYEVIVAAPCGVTYAPAEAAPEVRWVEADAPGYGAAFQAGVRAAHGQYIMTLNTDYAGEPLFIRDLWGWRHTAEVVIASRYVPGSRIDMTPPYRVFSRALNAGFSRGLSLHVRDMSSAYRLYHAGALRRETLEARDYDILQEVLVKAYADGWRVMEIPFHFTAAPQHSAGERAARFGAAYLRTFGRLWGVRNSILTADYDDRAYNSIIPLQRYWQRQRYQHVVELMSGEGVVLDVGCGSSRIIGALPPGSIGLDVLLRKVRYSRKFGRPLLQGTGFRLPFADASFPCVVCSQVIEHVPMDSPILDELCRVLKPGGRLILGTPDYAQWQWVAMEKAYGLAAPGGYADEHISHYTRDMLIDLFRARGYRLEDTRYILQGELILAFRKP